MMKLCIDPGHGGVQPGAVGRYSQEKDLTLAISKQLKYKLTTTGMQIIMTREDDSDITLQQRCNIANQSDCDLFISIHCNSFRDPTVTGTETYYSPNDMDGYNFATVVNDAAVSVSKNNNRGVKTGDFYVISYTTMTSILLECAFISNPNEEDMLNNPDWQDNSDEIPESIPGIKEIIQQPVGYDEYLIEDKRRIIHLNKYNYISLDPDGIRIFVDGKAVAQFTNK